MQVHMHMYACILIAFCTSTRLGDFSSPRMCARSHHLGVHDALISWKRNLARIEVSGAYFHQDDDMMTWQMHSHRRSYTRNTHTHTHTHTHTNIPVSLVLDI